MHACLFPGERRAAEKFLIKMEIFREFSGELRGQWNLLPGGPGEESHQVEYSMVEMGFSFMEFGGGDLFGIFILV